LDRLARRATREADADVGALGGAGDARPAGALGALDADRVEPGGAGREPVPGGSAGPDRGVGGGAGDPARPVPRGPAVVRDRPPARVSARRRGPGVDLLSASPRAGAGVPAGGPRGPAGAAEPEELVAG